MNRRMASKKQVAWYLSPVTRLRIAPGDNGSLDESYA